MCRRACNGGISQPDEQALARDVGGCNCGCGMRDDIASWMPQFGYPGCRMGFCNSGQRFSPSYSSIFLTLLLLALAHI
uniref:Uncharacterized protein n=1 Tax=Acrobeloides nanus TaxID=290746 RepID=A0A914CSN2_9BILA